MIQQEPVCPPSVHIDVDLKATLAAPLLAHCVLDVLELADVLLGLSLLPHIVSRPLSQLAEALEELALSPLGLFLLPPRKLCVEPFLGSPARGREGVRLDLAAEVEHHVAVCRLVRVGLEQVRQQLRISQLR